MYSDRSNLPPAELVADNSALDSIKPEEPMRNSLALHTETRNIQHQAFPTPHSLSLQGVVVHYHTKEQSFVYNLRKCISL